MYLHITQRRYYCLCSIFPFMDRKDYYADPDAYKPKPPPKTGLERVLRLVERDKYGYPSKEYISVIQHTTSSFFIGFLFGGIKKGGEANKKFIAANQHSKFISVYEARRRLSDYTLLEAIKGGSKYGVKCAVFTALFGLSVIIIAAFRGEDGILEYIVGGFFTGGIVRSYLGWRAIIGAGTLGGILGGLLGSFIYLGGKITGTTIADLRQAQYDIKFQKDKKNYEAVKNVFRDMDANKIHKLYALKMNNVLGYRLNDEDVAFVKKPVTKPEDNSSNIIKPPAENTNLTSQNETSIS